MRTQPCTATIRQGRLRKAEQFLTAPGLALKTKSLYSHTPVTAEEFKRAGRAAEALVEAARRAHSSAAT